MQSTYTGVYSRGGPTNVEPSRELSDLLDRSDADVRGVKKRVSGAGDAPLSARGANPSRLSTGGSEPPLTARGRRESSGESSAVQIQTTVEISCNALRVHALHYDGMFMSSAFAKTASIQAAETHASCAPLNLLLNHAL